jgi:hypothetical protein
MNVRSAYKLRFRDPEFRELWDLALEQAYVRLEMMLLERASGAGSLVIEGDKYLSETEKMDTSLALALLKQKQRRLGGRQLPGRPPAGKASIEDLRKEIAKKLSGLNKRLGGKG